MRLCFIANANSIHTKRWLAPFLERGDQVHLLSPRAVECGWVGLTDLIDLCRIASVPKARFAVWGLWIRRYVRQIQPDILHAHHLAGSAWLGAMAGFHPYVITAWGSDVLIEPQRSHMRRFLTRIVLHRCDRLTVPSQLMYNAATTLGFSPTRLHLIPWGVETDTFRPIPDDRLSTRKRLGIEEDAKVVLSPRAVGAKYNLDIVLQAFRGAATQLPEARLLLIRYNIDPPYLEGLDRLIAAYNLEDSVQWLPAQKTQADMARLYRMADVVVSIPSSEGYGFTTYEAMASGCPTLITDLPIYDGEITNGVHSLKVPVRSVAETSDALSRLLVDPTLRQRLRTQALDVCRGKSVNERIEKTVALYDELVGGR